jgi:hypothetical protein
MNQAEYKQIKFCDNDIVNPDDFIAKGQSNSHRVRPFLIHDHGICIAVAFADCLSDVFDICADEGKLQGFEITEENLGDYGPDEEGVSRLGNAGEAYDVEALDCVELPNPPFSFVALFNAMQGQKAT